MAKKKTIDLDLLTIGRIQELSEELADFMLDVSNALNDKSFKEDEKALLNAQRAILRAQRESSHVALCIAGKLDRMASLRRMTHEK